MSLQSLGEDFLLERYLYNLEPTWMCPCKVKMINVFVSYSFVHLGDRL